LVKNPQKDHFVYRDSVWRGADLLATGVASFGHLAGVHYQNVDQLEDYLTSLESGLLPLGRALTPTPQQLLIREMVLQLKEGRIGAAPFREKFGVNILDAFRDAFGRQQAAGYLVVEADGVRLTRKGLLQVDTLLPEFFEPEHRAVRYT
jgi:oxygen-independent coproporphyrinogen-3 oxidase